MKFITANDDEIKNIKGTLAVNACNADAMGALETAMGGRIKEILATEDALMSWVEVKFPAGLAAESLFVTKAEENPRELGAKLAAKASGTVTLFGGNLDMAFGFGLRAYAFDKYMTKRKSPPKLEMAVVDTIESQVRYDELQARIDGVHMTRDLVTEPANVLTTSEFATRIEGLRDLGVTVQILDEEELTQIGMRSLLAVGQGSEAPSKVAIMHWNGAEGAPLLLVGKGVVFDTGGISIKPAAGMEEMTMDMGGAATVVGTMKTIATRKAPAHVIGIVGLVENMPDGKAQRPGDIVKSLKGDTIEVLNTDAEGRMVLADILWYGQQQFKPSAVIDLATLTGAIIVALGHENAGVFGNDDDFTNKFLAAAKAENEGAWHMPIGPAYDKLIDRKLADMGNTGGRFGGSITAAQFLHRFVVKGTPWIHLDIAGVALRKDGDPLAPSGATGWGVRALDRLIRDHYEA